MNIWDWGIQTIMWLQGLGSWLVAPMKAFSFLGNEEFFLMVAPAIYWCVDAALGLRIGLFLMLSAGTNTIIKLALHAPRPYWYSPSVRAFTAEGSFGIPSGHAQNAVNVWGTLAAGLRRRWFWVSATLVILLIGLSRLYLGVHFPTDVLAGWLIGILLLWFLLKLAAPVDRWIQNHSLPAGLAAAFCLALALILAGALMRLSLSGWSLPSEWVENARNALPDADPIAPLAISGLITNAGAFFGLAAGALILRRRGGFDAGGPPWKRTVRYFVGVAGVLVLYMGLGAIFPRGESLLPYILRFIRYSLVGLWVTWLAPLAFYALKLADEKKTSQSQS